MIAIFVVWILQNVRFTHNAVSHGPTILTTTGIFATFLGIALGLSEFDSTNIQASVPALLTGLKTAFWASVAGVGGALAIHFRDFIFGSKASESNSQHGDETTAGDLADHLKNISRGLVGGDEGSLLSQIKLSRQDMNDRLDTLAKAQM